MKDLIWKNKEVIVLMLAVIVGLWLMLKKEYLNVSYKPRQIDMQCQGIHIPAEVKDAYRYCECMRTQFFSEEILQKQHCFDNYRSK